MFHHYLTASIRNFLRHPIYSAINVTGLVLGLTCSIFIFLWVLDELSFDHYHKDNDRVFKVMENQISSDGGISTDPWTPGILAETLKSEFPEVEQTSRMRSSDVKLFRIGEKANYEYGNYADKSIFDVLNLPLVEGNIHDALPDNHSVAISKKMALRYFNHYNVLGNTFQINNSSNLTITAVFEDIPRNATEQFDFILPLDLFIKEDNVDIYKWGNDGWLDTFVKLRTQGLQPMVGEKIKGLIKKHNKEFQAELLLFPMTEWRLYSHFENGKQSGGRISYVISFSLVAIFILLIACINFMNLSTARSANRSKEVGIRKVAGASRNTLIKQFLAESILLSLLSLLVALLLVHLLLPAFNDFTRKDLRIDYLNPIISSSLLLITLLTGFIAGSYPAFFLSSFRPVLVLKGNVTSDFRGASLRRALVVFQFCLSMIIIVCALVVNDQTTYMRSKNLGFDKKNVLMIQSNPEIFKSYEPFRNELLQQSFISSVALGAANPMEINGGGGLEWEGKPSDEDAYFNMANCDYDYIAALGFTLAEGRNFSRDFPADSANYIVTEGAVRKIGFINPIGQHLRNNGRDGQIVGVIKDFHNLGIRERYQPTVLTLGRNDSDFGRWATIFVRHKTGRTDEALASIQSVFKKNSPDFPIQFSFLEQDFEWQFRTEIMVSILTKWFTSIAVIISCLGLFGLALFNTEKRKKEISIRKVFGASVSKLVVLLCRDFIKLIIYAIVIAYPIGYYLTEIFLSGYAYHIQINSRMFILPTLALLIISLGIISYQSIRAALNNPAETMRSE